jgi:hypothetical protein
MLPQNVREAPNSVIIRNDVNGNKLINNSIYITGEYNAENHKQIMQSMGIVLDGKYRENTLPRGVFDYIEKYARTSGFAKEGLYCYNFCIDSSSRVYQPSGAINLGKFRNVELEFNTHVPKMDESNSSFEILCDDDGGIPIFRKSNWKLHEYSYNLVLFEERYNIMSFIGGNCGLMYAR